MFNQTRTSWEKKPFNLLFLRLSRSEIKKNSVISLSPEYVTQNLSWISVSHYPKTCTKLWVWLYPDHSLSDTWIWLFILKNKNNNHCPVISGGFWEKKWMTIWDKCFNSPWLMHKLKPPHETKTTHPSISVAIFKK